MDAVEQTLNILNASIMGEVIEIEKSLPVSSARVAYFLMEIGVGQSLHTYAGGLGYLMDSGGFDVYP